MAKPPIQFFRQEDFPEIKKEPWVGKLFGKLNEMSRQTQYGIDGKLSVKENISGFWWKGNIGYYTLGQSQPPYLMQEPWQNLTLQTGWGNVSATYPASYCKDSSGRVYVRGSVTQGEVATIATLPVGYRPAQPKVKPVCLIGASSGGSTTYVRINTDGTIVLQTVGTLAVDIDLSFYAYSTATVNPQKNINNAVSGFPLYIKNEMAPTDVSAIFAGYGLDITDGTTVAIPATLGPVAWIPEGAAIKVTSIGGMVPGRCYSVKLLVLGE